MFEHKVGSISNTKVRKNKKEERKKKDGYILTYAVFLRTYEKEVVIYFRQLIYVYKYILSFYRFQHSAIKRNRRWE